MINAITAAGFSLMCLFAAMEMPVPIEEILESGELYEFYYPMGESGRGPIAPDIIMIHDNTIAGSCKREKSPNLLCQEARNTPTLEVADDKCSELIELGHNAFRCKTDYIGLGTEDWLTCLGR